MKRNKERILLFAATLIVVVMAWQYNCNIKSALQQVEVGYSEKTVLNLNKNFNEKVLVEILSKADYFDDAIFERFLTKSLKDKLQNNPLPNLGALNKQSFMVNAFDMNQDGGEWGKFRYLSSTTELGQNPEFIAAASNISKLTSKTKISDIETDLTISGEVTRHSELSFLEKIKDKFHLAKKIPASNVIVCLKEELPQSAKDSIIDNYLTQYKNKDFLPLFADSIFSKGGALDLDKIVNLKSYYAVTDANGEYAFTHLEKGKNYSVIPIEQGKEFGVLKGVPQITQSITKLNFIEKEHCLPLFDTKTFALIKKDKALTVRTPADFKRDFMCSLFLFILGFWIFHLVLTFHKNQFEEYMLPILMLLTGLGLIVLYAVQDPLRDMDFGTSAANRMFYVLIIMSVFVLFFSKERIQRIATYRFGFILEGKKWLPKINTRKNSRGYSWLFLSFFVILMLAALGDGPQGSNVKVNLFGIQVSELSKFIMIVFFAFFFTANYASFRTITNNYYLIRRYSLPMLIGFGLLILLYVAIVGDQGPAMVLCITFLFFYAYGKNEFFQLVLSGIGFGVLLLVFSEIFGDTDLLPMICAVSIIATLLFTLKKRKYESVFFIVLLISSFVLLPLLGMGFSDRLADRNSMFADKWDNSLHGGDQVAQGVWALNSGGFFGQGLGKGLSNVMPAYHTDMMFESIGEELGMISLFAILVLFGLLFYRTMLVARRTGNTFFFYLINGFAIVTLIQLSIIVGGSLGLIPLTGISVPFLSKGDSGLMVNLTIFLLVIVLSQIRGNKDELRHIQKNFDNLNAYVTLTFGGVIVLFMATLGLTNLNANDTMIRPVKVLSKQGEWMYSENPRLSIIKDKLKAGSIYDRNGVLLATSDKEAFLSAQQDAQRNFANMEAFEKQNRSIQKRYYPFSEDLIFWLGDMNTGLVSNENIGYVAEYRLMSKLRGIEAPILQSAIVSSNQYQEAYYLPKETKESVLKQYDNRYYRRFLKAGIDSKLIEEENAKKDKDIYLTLDVKLNQLLNEVIRTDEYKDYKTSVVAIKTNSGDVLASAINPAPNANDIKKISQIKSKYYHMLFSLMFGYNHFVADRDFGIFYRSVPGSTIKAIDALAFLSRAGVGGADSSFTFVPEERIRKDEPFGKVDMRKAIVESSNIYFISLMNHEELHPELFRLYNAVGINIANKAGYYMDKPDNYMDTEAEAQWYEYVSKDKGLNFFNPKLKGTTLKYKGSDYSWISWGQGPVGATPLQMARLFGAVANHGPLFANKFLYKDNNTVTPDVEEVNLQAKAGITERLESFLQEQTTSAQMSTQYKVTVFGKTGSPERDEKFYDKTTGRSNRVSKTDGWYVFYLKNSIYEGSPIAFAIRIQGIGNSRHAAAIGRKIIEKLKANQIVSNK